MVDGAMIEPRRRFDLFGAPPIVLALAGVFMGCVMDAVIKHLGANYSAVLVAFWRYLFGMLVSGALVLLLGLHKHLPDGPGLRRHAVRAVASTASAVLFFHCLSVLPIAEATVLIFCAPLMIAPLARWILGERFRRMAVWALVIGFVGMLITVQGEDMAAMDARRLEGILSGVGAAVLYALSVVLLRQLAQKDDAVVTAFLGNVFPAVYLLIPAMFFGFFPALADIPVFAFTGFAGFMLWLMLTQAYARAPAQGLAVAEYSALIWSALLGYFFFSEIPRWQIWIGALVIVAAVMLSAWDGRRRAAAMPKVAD
jgi:S-adenosylmethionine uptake transporter